MYCSEGEKAIVRLKAKISIQRKGVLIAVYIRYFGKVTRIGQETFKNCFFHFILEVDTAQILMAESHQLAH
jgi:hypothetical protein